MLMIRPHFCSRISGAAARVTAKLPLRWVLMTASHSSSVMLKIMRSRRIPALLTTMSTRPKVSTAFLIEEMVTRNVGDGRLSFTTDLTAALRRSVIVFIAVGTPPKVDGQTDLSAVEAVAREIGRAMERY